MKKEKRIPTIIGLFVLIISVSVGVFFTTRGGRRIFSPKASGNCEPVNPQVTNITNTSFDISFVTTDNCGSSVIIDNRTIPNFRESSKIHYFQITNLKENTAYQFSFLSGGSSFSQVSYKGVTAKKPKGSMPNVDLAWGRILDPSGKPTGEAIIYINIPGASPLSSFVTNSGNWSISPSSTFNDLKDDWFIPQSNTEEDIIVIAPGKTTQITGNTSNNNPVPDITIGKDFLPAIAPTAFLSQSGISSVNGNSGNLVSISPVPLVKALSIDNPKEGEEIFSQRPDFFGSAKANTRLLINFDTSSIEGETLSNSSGIWHWSPPTDLSIGGQVINIKDSSSQNSVNRRFTILETSNTLSFTATPSAVIEVPTIIPTAIPTIRTVKPSTRSGVPVTGNSIPTVISLVFALTSIFCSFIFLKKKTG